MFERRVAPIVKVLLAEEPVIALQGPRSVGKTTLLRSIAEAEGAEVFNLDDLTTRAAVAADPALFMAGEPPVCVDEFQHVPEVLDAIKAELNEKTSPGRFVLTGSTRHDALPLAAQALTGRLHLLTVLPLSQGEIDGVHERFVEALFEDPGRLVTSERSRTSREDYIDRVIRGGFPLAIRRSMTGRRRWFDDYVTLSLDRDVRALANIRQRDQMPRLLSRLAGQTGQVLNVAEAASSVGLAKSTADDYVKLLEAVFLLYRLPAWGTTLTARSTALPKLHVVDSGLAARLLRLSAAKLRAADPASLQQFGHLLETFVVAEVRKQVSWSDAVTGIGHWRTHDGDEVDLVIEADDGRVAAVEVKAGTRVRSADLRSLVRLRDKLGDRFVAGIALYTGERSYVAEDRLYVAPVDRLWLPNGGVLS
ncbi:MAG: ATP-binding protein [Nitriliruptor sp.]|nr:MAG: ATP-binding protein [Nitriliruptor sp.]